MKDTFKSTSADGVIDMLIAMYEKSNERLRELNMLGEITKEHVRKPSKENATRSGLARVSIRTIQ